VARVVATDGEAPLYTRVIAIVRKK
jgi:hypothetical protein